MIQLESIELKDIVHFKSAKLPLNYKGITVIYGRNKDADSTSEKASNAAGKSLLVSAIAEAFDFGSPSLIKTSAQTRKDMYSRSGASTTLSFTKDDHSYILTKSMERSLKLDFMRDGKGLKTPEGRNVRRNDFVTEKMQKVVPVTEDEFYATTYIDSRRPSLLQTGTPTQRRDFFSQVFRLDAYDEIREVLRKEISELNVSEAKLEDILEEVNEVELLLGYDVEEAKEKYSLATSKLEKATKTRKKLSEGLRYAEVVAAHQDRARLILKEANALAKMGWSESDLTYENLESFSSQVTKQVKRVKAEAAEARHYAVWNKQYDQVNDTLNKLKGRAEAFHKLSGLDITTPEGFATLKVLAKNYAKLQGELTALDRQHAKVSKTLPEADALKRLKAEAKRLQAEVGDLDDSELETRWMKLRSKRSARKEVYSFFQDALSEGDCTCPTCESSLPVKQVKAKAKTLKAEIDSLTEEIESLQQSRSQIQELNRLVTEIEDVLKTRQELQEIDLARNNLLEVKAQHFKGVEEYDGDLYADAQTLATRIQDALERLAGMLEDEPSESEVDTEVLEKRLTRLSELNYALKAFLPVCKSYKEALEYLPEDFDTDTASETLKECDRRIKECMTSIPELRSKIDLITTTEEKLNKLRSKETELRESMRDKPYYEALVAAYSNKGLKSLMIQRLCSAIESNLNMYAPLIYREHIRFGINVSETALEIYYEKGEGKQKQSADVRRLSGAESRAFNMILPLALLPLIPSDRRFNVLILDEPTANNDPVMTDMFCTHFLPRLTSIIPHVIVVSPTKLPIDVDHRQYTVVRKNGVSELIDGDGVIQYMSSDDVIDRVDRMKKSLLAEKPISEEEAAEEDSRTKKPRRKT